MTTWSPQQEKALAAVAKWLRAGSPQVFYLAGYAGTGKTTLAKHLAGGVDGAVVFGAFTGKAASVMRRKGCRGASTIHSLIYTAEENNFGDTRFVLNPGSDVANAGLVIIDECSMVGEDLGRDLLSFGRPVLVLGDPAQLPPVGGEGFFTAREPEILLTEIHRQAAENPIIRLSMDIREGRGLVRGNYGAARVIGRDGIDAQTVLAADQVLVGLNRTRCGYNGRIRTLRGIADAMPIVGDKLVCLKNNRRKNLLNGTTWTVSEKARSRKPWSKLVVEPEDEIGRKKAAEIAVRHEFFLGTEGELDREDRRASDEFTFGYALTVHKSQGSQWDNVVLFDESAAFRSDAARWQYTAVTRAAETITIVRG